MANAESTRPSREDAQRRTQVMMALVCAVLIIIDVAAAFIFPWWRSRMIADFWPLDDSRIGPKLVGTLVQGVIGVIFFAIFWPPLRKRITSMFEDGGRRANREMHEKLAEMHEKMEHLVAHNSELHEKMERLVSHHSELHQKVDHLIRHQPEVPAFEGGTAVAESRHHASGPAAQAVEAALGD